jgi:UDP-2-acetamido-2,6-beta-L-arabino-hexul-4-ose reductase
MLNIGITGQNGFIGTHLYNSLGLFPNEFNRIDFRREWFHIPEALDEFVAACDVIVHLAALNKYK